MYDCDGMEALRIKTVHTIELDLSKSFLFWLVILEHQLWKLEEKNMSHHFYELPLVHKTQNARMAWYITGVHLNLTRQMMFISTHQTCKTKI